jgi:hypothetical protein
MYLKTTPARPARAEKRKGRPPAHWACVANRPGGRPPGPVGGPALWLLQETGPSQLLVLQACTLRASLISSAATVAFILVLTPECEATLPWQRKWAADISSFVINMLLIMGVFLARSASVYVRQTVDLLIDVVVIACE